MYIKHETYVDLKTAKLLKQVGFDWACDLYFSELVDAPAEAGIVDEDTNKVYGVFAVDVCGMPHDEDFLRPTLAVAQKWLIEVKHLAIYVCPSWEPADMSKMDDLWVMKWQVDATHEDFDSNIICLDDVTEICFNTYEEALEAGIKKTLELILEKGK